MKHLTVYLFFFGTCLASFSQQDSISVDSKYLDDQLYFAVSYNKLFDKNISIDQSGFPLGFSFGFIKDIPINDTRNFGFGLGFGYSYNNYIENLVLNNRDIPNYSTTIPYETNSFQTHSIDLPLELRWRTSTPTNYKFLRVYGGAIVSYIYKDQNKFLSTSEASSKLSIPNLNKTQVALALNIGYGTWNFFVNYYLSPFFTSPTLLDTGKELKTNPVRLGLIFYFL
ncbi:MAG: porin family protein [Flavicella sp.]